MKLKIQEWHTIRKGAKRNKLKCQIQKHSWELDPNRQHKYLILTKNLILFMLDIIEIKSYLANFPCRTKLSALPMWFWWLLGYPKCSKCIKISFESQIERVYNGTPYTKNSSENKLAIKFYMSAACFEVHSPCS